MGPEVWEMRRNKKGRRSDGKRSGRFIGKREGTEIVCVRS